MNIALVTPASVYPPRPFAASEIESLGIDRAQVRAAIRSGDLLTPFRGVYVRAGADDSIDSRARALVSAVSAEHIVCDRTAAWIHGIDAYAYAEREGTPVIETCAIRGHTRTRRGMVDGRVRDLRPTDVMEIDGLRVTTPLRTALDLGCNLRRREALSALNDFARCHDVTRQALQKELPRFKGRRGVVQLRDLLPLVDPRIESPRESWVDLALSDAGLPRPERQVWIEVDGVPTYRLDFAYRLARIAIEYDGEEAHESTPEQREYDEERRAWLVANGWTVIVVRRGDFTGDRLDSWIRQVKEALQAPYSSRRF